MAQQSDTEPRPAPKTQGRATHDLQQRIINKQENTKGTDAPLPGETLKHAAKRYPKPGPGSENQISDGDRWHDQTVKVRGSAPLQVGPLIERLKGDRNLHGFSITPHDD